MFGYTSYTPTQHITVTNSFSSVFTGGVLGYWILPQTLIGDPYFSIKNIKTFFLCYFVILFFIICNNYFWKYCYIVQGTVVILITFAEWCITFVVVYCIIV